MRPHIPDPVKPLPPLDALRFFEAAARHQSFLRAGQEIGVTAAAVAHRVRTLEDHLGEELFARRPRSVRLNRRGRAYHAVVRCILADIRDATALHADGRRFRGR